MSDTDINPLDQLASFLSVALQELIQEEGWKPPILIAMISVNEGLLFGRYVEGDHGGLKFETLAENLDAVGGFQFQIPINIFVINTQTGDAVLWAITNGDSAPRRVH